MKQVNVFATKRQAEAVRMLRRLLEEHAPRGENVRALMWPEIEIAVGNDGCRTGGLLDGGPDDPR